VGAASHHIHPLNVDLSFISLHTLGPVAHTHLSQQFLNSDETILMGAQLEGACQGLQIFALDEVHCRFELLHVQHSVARINLCQL